MESELDKIKNYTKNVSLKPEEKIVMLNNIRNYTTGHQLKVSPYYIISKHAFAYLGILIFLIGTTATSIAAEKSLPGEFLYPIKTEINEGIYKSLNFGDKNKAKANVKLIEKRMIEVNELVAIDMNNIENIEILSEKLDEHITEIEDIYTKNILEKDEKEEVLEIYNEIDNITNNQIDILNDLLEENTNNLNPNNENKEIKTSETIVDIDILEKTVIELASSTKETSILENNFENTITEIIEFSEKIEPVFEEILQE